MPGSSSLPVDQQETVADDQSHGQPSQAPRTPRRTPMACQFCRGRKLKCDGARPSCVNCSKRNLACAYVPV
ncbi:hypothetical protein BKA70DRAFT_1266743 [Coprinopsis sp. MPI-PUGE-AT-0042]|nr:hypothetical protein BKA70DRAFT_1266743 [Coprinopsis sp. MPI-PUGE-AT-0042]